MSKEVDHTCLEIFKVGVADAKSTDLTKDESLQNTSRVCGSARDIEVQVHWFLVEPGHNGAVFCDRDGNV